MTSSVVWMIKIPFFTDFLVWAAGGRLEDSGGKGSFHKNSQTKGAVASGSGRSLLTPSKDAINPSDFGFEFLFLLDDVMSQGGGIPPCTQKT